MEPLVREKINAIRAKIRKDRNEQATVDMVRIPSQYPSMKPKEAVTNMVSSLTDMDMNDCDDDTDDEVMQCTSAFMVASRAYTSTQVTRVPIDPPGLLDTSSAPIEPSGSFKMLLSIFEYDNIENSKY